MKKNNITTAVVIGSLGILAIFLGVSFFMWTLVPYLQMTRYVHMIKSGGEIVWQELNRQVFTPYTYAQPDMRNDFLDRMITAQESGRADLQILTLSLATVEDVIARDPHYPRYYYTLTRAYLTLAKKDPAHAQKYLAKASEYFQTVYALIPNSQETSYAYSVMLVNQGKYEQAIQLLDRVIAAGPEVPQSHEYLGRALIAAGTAYYDRGLAEFETFYQSGRKPVSPSIMRASYLKLLGYYQKKNDREKFFTVLKRLKIIDSKNLKTYQQVEDFVTKNGRLPNIGLQ